MEEFLEPIESVGHGFLHTSPEFALKRALASGVHRLYSIGPCFRAEEEGQHHTAEFTMLEWYRAGAGTPELMDEVEDLVAVAAHSVGRAAPSFVRRSVGSLLSPTLPPDEWMFQWVDQIEPQLTAPTIVYGYPEWQSALAQVKWGTADRFEVYLGGLELANAFAEETDASELRRRWTSTNQARALRGRPAHPIDERFLSAVDRMPRAAGIALGIDRLVMALTDTPHIQDVQIS